MSSPSESIPESAAILADAAFGVGGQQYSMSPQFNSCSAGKLNFVPASGFSLITNGVMELMLSATVVGTNIFDLQNPMCGSHISCDVLGIVMSHTNAGPKCASRVQKLASPESVHGCNRGSLRYSQPARYAPQTW